jgi:1-acyl-sn-glycerol-3-phosphate acyltransferase
MISGILTAPRVLALTARHMRRAENEIRSLGDIERSSILRLHKQQWAREVLDLVGVQLELIGELPKIEGSVILVGNHIGFLDIPVVISYFPVSFVAKHELRKWLIIGRGCELTETILVDRSSVTSRKNVTEQILNTMSQDNRQLCIFPSGTTTLDESKHWQTGAFRIAEAGKIPIIPFRLRYDPLRTAAYIDRDNFMLQLWKIGRARPLKAQIEFHQPIMIQDPKQDAEHWRNWTRKFLV